MAEIIVDETPSCGLGLFTREHIREGSRICDFKLLREVSSLSELRADLGEEPDHCTTIDGRFFLVGAPERHLNHSCDPNAYTRFDDEGISVVALRDLDAGCELTVDYLIDNKVAIAGPAGAVRNDAEGKRGSASLRCHSRFRRSTTLSSRPGF